MGGIKINYRLDTNELARMVISEQLNAIGVRYELGRPGEIVICDEIKPEKKAKMSESLRKYGIVLLEDKQFALVERIKNSIDAMLRNNASQTENVSNYLASSLHYSYSYLSEVFSENTFSSIENYVILRKVDLVKDLMADTDLTLTEIAYKLDYSSVAHLSAQFKKTTGLTPSTFRQIIKKRKEQVAE